MATEEDATRHLFAQATRCMEAGDLTDAEVHLTAALEHARARGRRAGTAEALRALAHLRRVQRRLPSAERLEEEASRLDAE